jgi:uncharacterized protein YpmB
VPKDKLLQKICYNEKMKKHKKLFITLIIIAVIIFLNIAYFVVTNWQNFFPTENSSGETVSLKTYSSSKMGFEVKYPASWKVQDSGNTVQIDPVFDGNIVHFSIGSSDNFKSLDDVKKTLAATVPLTPVQINNATGFEYQDSPSYEVTWLSNSGNVYLIRTYSNLALADEEGNQILATLKFKN